MTIGIRSWRELTIEERVAAIRPLWLAGHPASYISRELGAGTRNVIIGLIHRHIKDGPRKKRVYPPRAVRRAAARLLKPVPAPKRLARPRAPAAVPLTPPPAEGKVAFLDLRSGLCTWIYGDPGAVPVARLMVCGEPVQFGKSYCAGHCRAVFIPVKSDGRRRNNHFGLVAR